MKTLPPIGKQKRYAPQSLFYIHALEVDPPSDRDPIDWKLVSNQPVDDLAATIEKLDWYATRWKIEMFHKVMKSGCRSYGRIWVTVVDQAARFCLSSVLATPSMNLTPSMSRGN